MLNLWHHHYQYYRFAAEHPGQSAAWITFPVSLAPDPSDQMYILYQILAVCHCGSLPATRVGPFPFVSHLLPNQMNKKIVLGMNEYSHASIAKTKQFARDFMPACHWKEPWSQCTWLSQHINYNSRYIKYQIILYNEEHTHISEEVVFSTRSLHFLDFARFRWGWWRSD